MRGALLGLVLLVAACGPPVALEQAAPIGAAAPDVAQLRCGPDGVEVVTPRVAAQADGVHVEVAEGGGATSWDYTDATDGGRGGLDLGAMSLDVAPGVLMVRCGTGDDQPEAALEVVDPAGFWVPDAVEGCQEFGDVVHDYVDGAAGEPDPLAVAEEALRDRRVPGDAVRQAGYLEGEGPRTYVQVVDGRVVAAAHLQPDFADGSGWLLEILESCVRPVAGAADAPPDVARLRCGPEGVEVETPTVAARADGVHVEVLDGGGATAWGYTGPDREGQFGYELGAAVLDVGPGQLRVTCDTPLADRRPDAVVGNAPEGVVEVVDPGGHWVARDLDCEYGFSRGSGSRPPDAVGEPDPQVLAERALAPYSKPGDVVRRTRYSDGTGPRRYALVADGRTVAVARLVPWNDATWMVDYVDACSGPSPSFPPSETPPYTPPAS